MTPLDPYCREAQGLRKLGFNLLVADADKIPIVREWKQWQTQAQTDRDVDQMWKQAGATCFGPICGFGGLEVIDFDHAWIYRLWAMKFGDRAYTRTIATPHHGRHVCYLTDAVKSDSSFKASIGVELKGPGTYVVDVGKAKREDGVMGEYVPVTDAPPVTDNEIVADT